MKQIKFILILGIIFIGIRCNDATNIEETREQHQIVSLEDINYSPIFKNPYEEVGIYHNDGLKYVFEEYYKQGLSRASANQQEKLNELMVNFFTEKRLPLGIEVSKEDSKNFLRKLGTFSISRAASIEFENTMQQKFCTEVRELLSGKKTISSPQALLFEINKIEKKIAGSKMSEFEKAQVLIATAVAKHSSIFWTEQMLSSDNAPTLIKSRSNESWDDPWLDWYQRVFMPKAMQVLQADFTGAVAGIVEGFIFGGAAGSIVPGAGTVTVL